MKFAVFASLIAAASAMAPPSKGPASKASASKTPASKVSASKVPASKVPASKVKALKVSPASKAKKASTPATKPFADELGAQVPLGFWDPLGLVASGDQAKFDRLRYVELKHGRIAMLAVVGYLTAEAGIRLPGDISYDGTEFADIPNGFAALSAMPAAGLTQILAFIGYLEISGWKQAKDSFPGDFSASAFPVGFIGKYNDATKLKKRAIELNQGRAAQMGILALMVHEQLGVSILPPH